MPCHAIESFSPICGHVQTLTTHVPNCPIYTHPQQQPKPKIPICINLITTRNHISTSCIFCQKYSSSDKNKDPLSKNNNPRKQASPSSSSSSIITIPKHNNLRILSTQAVTEERQNIKILEEEKKKFSMMKIFLREFHESSSEAKHWHSAISHTQTMEAANGVPELSRTFIFNPYTPSSDLLQPVLPDDAVTKLYSLIPHSVLPLPAEGRGEGGGGGEEINFCGICLDILFTHRDIRRLPCPGGKCVFCLECIADWFEKQDNCPNCRRVFRLERLPWLKAAEDGVERMMMVVALREKEVDGRWRRRRHSFSVDRDAWGLA